MSVLFEDWVEEVGEARAPRGYGGRFFGAYPALVKDIKDPDGQGRVKVSLPWSPDGKGGAYEAWARLATLMAGNNRGTWFIPDVNDEVLVLFVAGDPRQPTVVGGYWNGRDSAHESMDGAAKNAIKSIRSRNGVKVTLDDTDGQERMVLETPGGQKVTLKDGPGSVEIIDSNGNSVKLEAAGITVSASAKVTISGSLVEISAGSLTVNAGFSRFNGVAQADTVISPSVVGSSYTPGAGNIW
jgi:uncharacterized protein involved in type VI secretion and phage assembly